MKRSETWDRLPACQHRGDNLPPAAASSFSSFLPDNLGLHFQRPQHRVASHPPSPSPRRRVEGGKSFLVISALFALAVFSLLLPHSLSAGQENQADPVSEPQYLIHRSDGLVTLDAPPAIEGGGVRLADGRVIEWDLVVGGAMGAERQVGFEERIAQLGEPLFRLKAAVQRGDWVEAEAAAGGLDGKLPAESLGQALIRLAEYRGAMASSRRERAVVAWLRLMMHPLRAEAVEFAGPRCGILYDWMESGVAGDLPPVFIDPAAARDCLAELQRLPAPEDGTRPAGWFVYGTALALAADDLELAGRWLKPWGKASGPDARWREVSLFAAGIVQDQLLVEPWQVELIAADEAAIGSGLAATADWWLAVGKLRQYRELAPRRALREMLSVAARREAGHPVVAELAMATALELATGQKWEREVALIRAAQNRAVAKRLELEKRIEAWPP